MKNKVDELEKAHRDYELRRNEMLSKIQTIRKDNKVASVYNAWLKQIEEFIKEREI